MKRLLLVAALLAGAPACVDANADVTIFEARPLDPETCGPLDDESVFQKSGRLNYSVGRRFVLGFRLETTVTSPEGRENEVSNDFFADEIVLSYESVNPDLNFEEEAIPTYFVVREGDGSANILVNLIGPKAVETLNAAEIPAPPGFMTLFSTLKIRGKLGSGGSAETNEATFPIDIYRGEACPAGTSPVGTCGVPGQDGYGHSCI